MIGTCIENGERLVQGRTYFLFECGPEHYYVSKFDNKGAHFGAFQRKYFEVAEDKLMTKEERLEIEKRAWPDPPLKGSAPLLERGQTYKADLIWRRFGYKMVPLGPYYIKPDKTHARFYNSPDLKGYRGSYPIEWFSNFEKYELSDPPFIEVTETELPASEWSQMNLFEFIQ